MNPEGAEYNRNAKIQSVGIYLPLKKLTNDDLSKMVDTSDEWIQTRTGIKERRIAEANETTTFMAIEAAKNALSRANLKPHDIDLVIVATATPETHFPSVATQVQAALGLRPVPSFDLSAACSGFLYALETGRQWISSGQAQHVLIIGSEKMSNIVDWADRSTCVLFGDGAGAAVLSVAGEGIGFIDTQLFADGSNGDALRICEDISRNGGKPFIHMNGKDVFKFAINAIQNTTQVLLERNRLTLDDLSLIVPHQANQRILSAAADKLGLSIEKFASNVSSFGNTSAASIPIALYDALQEGKIKSGDLVLLIAFGAGLTWGGSLIKWQ